MRRTRSISLLIAILTAAISVAAYSMPPHPDVIEKYRKAGKLSELAKKVRAMQARRSHTMPKKAISSGTMKVPVVLVDYADIPMDSSDDQSFYFDLLNGTTSTDLSVTKYYYDMSNSNLTIEFDVFGPVTVSQSLSYYGSNDIYGNDEHVGELVNEAVTQMVTDYNAITDFSDYDNDDSGEVDCIIAIHAGAGEEASGIEDQIWSSQWDLASAHSSYDGDGIVTADGVDFNYFTVQPEFLASAGDSTIGVYCHELGHILGLPDLYDTTYETNGIGDWSLMSGGAWGGGDGSHPTPILAWERFQIGGTGWVSEIAVGPATVLRRDNGNGGLPDLPYPAAALSLILLVILMSLYSSRSGTAGRHAAAVLSCFIIAMAASCDSSDDSKPKTNYNVISIDDIETSHSVFTISLNDPSDQQYLVLEGKKASTTGWYVPGSGVLITHIHNGILATYYPSNSVNDGSDRVHGVNVIEAGTPADIGRLWTNSSYNGSASDLFCAENNQTITVSTLPNSRYYTGPYISSKSGDSGVTITSFSSRSSFPMTFAIPQ